ncbi:MAG: glycosyltransferase family 2 protein [Anaerolineae bacterium]|nr:MAG: glycosyltransferase family 2 protein [Anaerolineae bacterium]
MSVVIPHWNGRQHLDECLTSLRNQTFSNHEVILVDNGSDDGSQEYVSQTFPEVRLIELSENRGFTGACNAGYAASQGEFICLLNNDTEAHPDWLEVIVDTFTRHPEAGVVASKMLLFDRRDHFHTAGDYYRVNGLPGNRGVWQADRGQYDHEEEVFSACGGAAAYRRAIWKVIYAPGAIVYHKLKSSGGSGVIGSFHDGRNFLYVIWKNYPTALLRQHAGDIARAQLNITKEALKAWRGPAARARLRGQLAGLFGFPRMLSTRRRIQSNRKTELRDLEALMTQVDEVP